MEMRLGKTLTIIRHLLQCADAKMILIVAPYSALSGWEEELTHEEQGYIELFGTKEKRLESLAAAGTAPFSPKRTWCLLNKEGFLVIPEVSHVRWDAIILDESTFIKNPQAKVTKFFTSRFQSVKYRFILSGTPAPETELEYFTQLFFLNPAILGYRNFWEFRLAQFSLLNYDWLIKKSGRAFLSQRLSMSCFFLKRNEVGFVNEKIYERRVVELPTEIRKAYDELEENFWTELDGKDLKSPFAGVRYSMLRQLCSGFTNGYIYDSFKINELQQLLTGELAEQKVVVWAWYVQEVREITNQLKIAGLSAASIYGDVPQKDRNEIRKAFQNGNKIKVIVAQPEVWKYGTTLSEASVMIYFSSPQALLTRQQSEDRTIDISKTGSALIIDLVCKNTVEEDILLGLKSKERNDNLLRRIVDGIRLRND